MSEHAEHRFYRNTVVYVCVGELGYPPLQYGSPNNARWRPLRASDVAPEKPTLQRMVEFRNWVLRHEQAQRRTSAWPIHAGNQTGGSQTAQCWAGSDSKHKLPIAENLLNCNLTPEAPNQVWTSDICRRRWNTEPPGLWKKTWTT
jgi:hypothetical protein